MTTVVYLTGNSMNDALASLGRAHRKIFEELGHDFVAINLVEANSGQILNDVIQNRDIEFVYSAMGGGASIAIESPDTGKQNAWEGLKVPFLSIMGDTPAYFFDRHVMETPWHACLYCYPEHLDFRKRFLTKSSLYGVVPPSPIDLTDRRDIDFSNKERGRLLFLKNGNDPEQLVQSWKVSFSTSTFLMLADLAGALVANITSGLGNDIDDLVVSAFAQKGWDIQDLRNLRLIFVAQLDDYLRRIKSSMIADAIADFPVEIHGFNWEHFDFSRRKAKYFPGSDYTQSRALIADSLGLIDMSPNTERAPHDRPMRAFGLYTMCLTNSQKFFLDSYECASEFSFEFEKAQIQHLIAETLANPSRAVEIGIETAEKFRREHRPIELGQYLLDTASFVRTLAGVRPHGLQNYFAWPPANRE